MRVANRFIADFTRRRNYRKNMHIFVRHNQRFTRIEDLQTDTYHSTVNRPVEDAVFNKILYNRDYDFDDAIYKNRVHNLEFSDFDFQLYQLLKHLKNRYKFGYDDKSQKEERATLNQISKIMNVNHYDMIVFYAEFMTKIERRKRANLVEIPVIPESQLNRHQSIIKRMENKNVLHNQI